MAHSRGGSPVEVALVGDTMLTRRLPRKAAAVRYARSLLRRSDLAIGNLETLYHDYEFPPMAEAGGTYVRSAPGCIRDIVWLGFRAMTVANNHAGDYGGPGLLRSLAHLDTAGVVVAGAGASRREARAISYVDTEAGRVALIAATSTFPAHAKAGAGFGDVPARPGVNGLAVNEVIALDSAAYDAMLTHVAEPLGKHVIDGDEAFALLGAVFARSDRSTRLVQALDPAEVEEHAELVSVAVASADVVLVSLHTHERGATADEPPAFAVDLSRRMIDAGAHCVFMHGTHRLRGVERYRHGLVCYGLGNFAYQPEGITRFPADALEAAGCGDKTATAEYLMRRAEGRWSLLEDDERTRDSVVVRLRWDPQAGGVQARVHPLELASADVRGIPRGTPRACDAATAERILNHVAELSPPGTVRLTGTPVVGKVG